MSMTTRRVRYIGRNHDTPSYQPVQMHETIAPIERAEHPLVSLALWLMIIAAVALTWAILP